MDETHRSTAGSNSSSMRVSIQEGDSTIEKLAPVSLKGSQKINKVFHELIDNWKKYTAMEDGDRIAQMLQNYSVEKQLEHISEMQKDEILDVIRFNLRKLSSVQEENDQLTKRNRDISEKLHRIEHRVGKAQVEVFDKIQETTMDILKDFHTRELDLARKAENLEAEKAELTTRTARLEAKVEELERKSSSLETKNHRLLELKEENEKSIAELTLKNQKDEDEIFRLREQLEKATELARERNDEALHEHAETARLTTLIMKERNNANLEAKRLQDQMQKEMDKYKADLEHDLALRQQRHKKEIEALNAKYDATVTHKAAVILDLEHRNRDAEAEIQKFKRNFEMMEAQIKGNMKRSLQMNYHEMLNIISSGSTRLPEPPRENPFLADLDKENSRRKSSPSPKRTLGVQTSGISAPRRAPSAPPGKSSTQPKTSKFAASVSSARAAKK